MDLRGSQSGNVVLPLMLGLFLLGLSGGAFYFLSAGGESENQKAAREARAAYDEAVARLDRAMRNPASLEASLDRNASFQCLFSSDGACAGKGGAFFLFEPGQASRPLSQLARDAGSDAIGTLCRGFPSRDCPLRVETVWEPVCGGSACENTKSLRVRGRVTLAGLEGTPLEWNKEELFTPAIQLSQGASCARGGGEWSGAECLTPAQAAERRLASPSGAAVDQAPRPAVGPEGSPGELPPPAAPMVYECPNQIVVQGQYYPVEFLAADRSQVAVPAMSCPQAGLYDVFVFQCSAKSPASFPNEGQWVQVEAVMAPACGQDGRPAGDLPVRF